MYNTKNTVRGALDGLRDEDGIPIPKDAEDRLNRYFSLVREWNPFANLVSKSVLARHLHEHAIDSLSLVSIVNGLMRKNHAHLDIGPGAGFPIVPMSIVLPELEAFVVERSEKKVGFLHKVKASLGLDGLTILSGSFPDLLPPTRPTTITARAVEHPDTLLRFISEYLDRDSCFLCQSGDPAAILGIDFKVDLVEDRWTRDDLRRGELFLVRRTIYP